MKKLLCIIFAFSIIFCGCSNKKVDESKDSSINNELNISSEETVEIEDFNPWLHQPSVQEYYDKLKSKYGDKLSELKISDWGGGIYGLTSLKYEDLQQEIKIEIYSIAKYNGKFGVSSIGVKFSNAYDKITGEILDRFVEPFALYYEYQPDYISPEKITELFESNTEIEELESYGSKFYRVSSGSEFTKNDTEYDFSKGYFSKNGGTDTWQYIYYLTLEPVKDTEVYYALYY